MSETKYPTKEEFSQLIGRWQRETHKVKKDFLFREISRGVEGLVHLLIKRYAARRADINEDMYQAAQVGIFKAAKKYDASKNVSFITYVGFWIRSELSKALKTQLNLVKIPQKEFEMMYRAAKEEEEENPYPGYIYWEGHTAGNYTTPNLQDRICSEHELLQKNEGEILVRQKENGSIGQKFLQIIDNKEDRNILMRRFEGETLKDIGKSIGLSRERVRQREEKALSKLRRLAKKGEITDPR